MVTVSAIADLEHSALQVTTIVPAAIAIESTVRPENIANWAATTEAMVRTLTCESLVPGWDPGRSFLLPGSPQPFNFICTLSVNHSSMTGISRDLSHMWSYMVMWSCMHDYKRTGV